MDAVFKFYKHSKILNKYATASSEGIQSFCFLCFIAFEHSVVNILISGVIYLKIYTGVGRNKCGYIL